MKTQLKLMLVGAALALSQGAHAQMAWPGFVPFVPMPRPLPPVFVPPPMVVPAPPVFAPSLPQQPYMPPTNAPAAWGQAAGLFGVNHEGQVATECIAQYGPSKAGAACIATRLSVDEIEKCFNDGIGGRGCFGDNNTIVQVLRANLDAAQREPDPAAAWIRLSTGISVTDISREGILGGENSEARKLCDGIADFFGGDC